MKVKLFTHNDLDGAVSNLIALKYFIGLRYSASTDICSYGNVDKNIEGYLNSYEYDPEAVIVVTDISFSEEVAEKLDKVSNPVIMLDHHKTAEEVFMGEDGRLKYKWMRIQEGNSASFMAYKYFRNRAERGSIVRKEIEKYKKLVYLTDLWDTKSRQSEEFVKYEKDIKKVLDLFKGLGYNEFKDRFFGNPSIEMSERERAITETIEKTKKRYMSRFRVYNLPISFEGENHLYGFGFSSDFVSEVAEHIFSMNDRCLFSVTLDMNGCSGSFRRNEKHPEWEKIDVSKIAEQFGGGGHPFAAGFEFEIKDYDRVIKKIIKSEFDI